MAAAGQPPGYVVDDEAFRALVVAADPPRRLHTGLTWAEGPVYRPATDDLLFSDVPGDTMWRWSATAGAEVYRRPSQFANGSTLDQQGRVVTCEQGTRRIARTEPYGSVVGVVGHFGGARLNSPNDVVVRSDGTIWFSDPDYGILSNEQGYQAESELGHCYVFRFDPRQGRLSVVADDLVKPNGLAFSVDETVLYVTDSAVTHDPDGPHHIRAYDVVDHATLVNSRVVAVVEPGWPDGLRVDAQDHLWVSSGEGIQCYTPDGRLLGRIRLPEIAANCEFGGPDRNQLFITATSSLYLAPLRVAGAR
ncbi:SMP-30/gluconolactonase/LRE family protein [Natronosporangium hydrolyticum]|uniref:SMP-30/gluconolactonase/LRE family protein n=2 Tax=Natronosporangium hydrolyticum TaxID=2811111 RepID=A0A895YHQ3_9ACTN|nr:SMP-30/gluconolactonase/LRE family protein [Natronosporangium hydrolyticum]